MSEEYTPTCKDCIHFCRILEKKETCEYFQKRKYKEEKKGEEADD